MNRTQNHNRAAALLALLGAVSVTSVVATRDARANGAGLPDSNAISLIPGNTTALGIEANFGYLEAPDGQNFTWMCHDVLVPSAATLTPIFFRNSNGAFLASVRSIGIANNPNVSLFRSADGCTWSAVAGVDQVLLYDVAFDPSNASHVLAVSQTGGTTPASNGVYVSNDEGRTWAASSLSKTQRYFRSIRFSPTDPQTVYATANWITQAWIYASTNGGASFSELPWTFAPTGTVQTIVDIAAVSPTDARVVYARVDGSTDYLLRSSNGGLSFGVVHTVIADDIKSTIYEPDGSAVWTAAKDFGTFRSTDGKNFTAIPTTTPVPHIRGLAVDARGVFAVANNYEAGSFALGRTNDAGASFTPLFHFVDLKGVRACPAGSDVANVCTPLWPALAQSLGIATPTPSPTPTPNPGSGSGGCKCDVTPADAAPAGGALLALAAVAAWIGRRRAR